MKTYLISFGNSTQYLMDLPSGSDELADVKKDVEEYLEKNFPEIKALNYYDKMTVKEIPAADAKDYAGYEKFSAAAIPAIEKVLATEVEDEASLDRLNSNAAFGNISFKEDQ